MEEEAAMALLWVTRAIRHRDAEEVVVLFCSSGTAAMIFSSMAGSPRRAHKEIDSAWGMQPGR